MNYVEIVDQINAEDYTKAIKSLSKRLDDSPSDPMALFLMARIFLKTERRGLAYNLLSICAEADPSNPSVWVNYGAAHPDTQEGLEGAEHCFNMALQIKENYGPALSHLSTLAIQKCDVKSIHPYADKALEQNPDDITALTNKAFGYLFEGKWEEAWKHYDFLLETKSRTEVQYNDLPRWDGTKGQTVIVSGEQGLGDEILYSSVIEDMSKDVTVIYDCFPRLEKLLERSFKDNPNVHILGSRWKNDLILPMGLKADAQIQLAGVCQFYRNNEESFPGDPYLKADEDIKTSIRALLDSLGDKPKVGIAWSGGTDRTRGYLRTRDLEELTPLLRQDVTWISLQYKDPSKEIEAYKEKRGIEIHHFDWLTEQKEYDYTAALVSELDLVITVPTSVSQLAGALGVETWVMVPKITGWLFHRETYPWAKSVQPLRNMKASKLGKRLKEWIDDRKTKAERQDGVLRDHTSDREEHGVLSIKGKSRKTA